MASKTPRKFLNRLIVLLVVVAVAAGALAVFRIGDPPEIRLEPDMPGIGKRTPVTVTVEVTGRGLGPIRVELSQGNLVQTLAEREHRPRPFWAFWGPRDTIDSFRLEIGRETVEGLQEGEASIRVIAERAGTPVRRPEPARFDLTLPVRLVPPSIEVMSTAVYVTQGGCEAVAYRVGETAVRDGVRAGDWWFPGAPLPGGDGRDRFALFAAPYDLDDESGIRLIAVDDVANESQAAFVSRFNRKPFKRDTIRVSESFMNKVVPAILSRTPELTDRGDLLQNYLMINNELRKANAETLVDLAAASAPEFLWTRPFMQMRNAQVMSAFADRRTYVYDGREVDQQDHLGFDLASTQRAEIPAANDGVVVLARYFGIYGNAVIIDHGHGLMSLYGHLSSIAVSEGQDVLRGETIGRTGATGLAGGDHLHFTMLLHGLAVNPMEWWDGHWIDNRIAAKIGPALPLDR